MANKKKVVLVLTYTIGSVIAYMLAGLPLMLIYSMIWLEKVILGAFSPIGMIGIEFSTLSTVLAAILYGPFYAVVFTMVTFPILRGLRYALLPLTEPEWPPFFPGPDDALHASGALVGALISSLPFFWIMAIVSFYKTFCWAYIIPRMMEKPWNPFASITTIIFNLSAGAYFGLLFFSAIGMQKLLF